MQILQAQELSIALVDPFVAKVDKALGTTVLGIMLLGPSLLYVIVTVLR